MVIFHQLIKKTARHFYHHKLVICKFSKIPNTRSNKNMGPLFTVNSLNWIKVAINILLKFQYQVTIPRKDLYKNKLRRQTNSSFETSRMLADKLK